MNRKLGAIEYSSEYFEDHREGFAALQLFCKSNGETKHVASATYWDACGQFYVETFGTDVPLDILEELIAEAKNRIKTE